MSEQRFPTPNPIRLELKIPLGDVDAATVDGDQSTVAIEGSPKLVDATTVELSGDRLTIGMRRKSFGFFGAFDGSLSVTVRVPHHSTAELVTASGDAAFDGTWAELEARSASGDIVARGEIEGKAKIKTVSGDVQLAHVAGDLDAQSVSGRIATERVDGSASAKSVSGDIRVGSLREGRATVHSVSGDVEIGIASGTGVDVDAGTASGELSSEVALSSTPSGSAGPTVIVRGKTVSGDIRIVRAA